MLCSDVPLSACTERSVEIDFSDTPVILPWASITSSGIAVSDPYVPGTLPLVPSSVSARSNVTTFEVTVVVIPVPPVKVRFSSNNCITVEPDASPATVKLVAISLEVTVVIRPLLSTENWGIELVVPYDVSGTLLAVPSSVTVNIFVVTFSLSPVETRFPSSVGSVNVEFEVSDAGHSNLI